MDSYSDEVLIKSFHTIFGVEACKNDWALMKQDFVTRIYSLFLRDFGWHLDLFGVLPFDLPDNVHQYPEHYRKAFYTFRLAKAIQSQLQKIGDDEDFCHKDLLSPDPKRTKYFFTTFLNFYATINEVLPQLDACKIEVEKEVEEKLHLIKRVKQLQQEKQRQVLIRAEEELRRNELFEAAEIEKHKVQQQQDIKMQLKSKLESVKEQNTQLKISQKDIDLKILEAERENENLSSQIILDSERGENAEKESIVQSHQSHLAQLKEKEKLISSNLQLYEHAQELLKSISSTIADIKTEKTKEHDCRISQKKLNSGHSQMLEQHNHLVESGQSLVERITLSQEKKNQFIHSHTQMSKNYQQEIQQKKKLLEEMQLRKEENKSPTKEAEIQMEKLKEEYKTFIINMHEFKTFTEKAFSFINEQFDIQEEKDKVNYSSDLQKILKGWGP